MIEVGRNLLQRLTVRIFGNRVIKEHPFKEMLFLEDAREVRSATRVPLVLLGGIVSVDNLERAMREGFDFVAMGPALIADPDLINRTQRGAVFVLDLPRATSVSPKWTATECAASCRGNFRATRDFT
jgi:2,4-dienoyl-CoA reductase-like NADH-dependent reductase (Old Yellow Enzyme family)